MIEKKATAKKKSKAKPKAKGKISWWESGNQVGDIRIIRKVDGVFTYEQRLANDALGKPAWTCLQTMDLIQSHRFEKLEKLFAEFLEWHGKQKVVK